MKFELSKSAALSWLVDLPRLGDAGQKPGGRAEALAPP